ncbi:amidohydrolase family protein [Paenibacillus peoriae]|uniref:amidohydrolase family protein n=1 Tax=Paenibacillus peoriae TaxID=59893 RepID=UPI003F989243
MKNGVDLIKICVTGGVTDANMVGEAGRLQMTEEEVTAICEEAHKIGMRVAAHVESTEGVRIALKGGVDTIEHGAEMDEEIISLYKNNPRALKGYTALIPTMQAAYPTAKLDTGLTKVNETVKENSRLVYDSMLKGLRQAVEHHIKIGVGTDAAMSYVTHYDIWRELRSIDIGKQADLIVMEQNPLDNIKALSDVAMVMVKGNLIQTPSVTRIREVDELLDSVW